MPISTVRPETLRHVAQRYIPEWQYRNSITPKGRLTMLVGAFLFFAFFGAIGAGDLPSHSEAAIQHSN